jgi:hypothetical protein
MGVGWLRFAIIRNLSCGSIVLSKLFGELSVRIAHPRIHLSRHSTGLAINRLETRLLNNAVKLPAPLACPLLYISLRKPQGK